MKKALLCLLLMTSIVGFVNAQKIYSTKIGQVKFNATANGPKIVGINNQVDSKMAEKNGQIIFNILIKGFKFDNQFMEDHFNENYMESSKFPKADFKGFIKNISTINFSKDGNYNVTAEGDLTIHGVTKKVTVQGVLTVAGGKVSITASFKVNLKEYGVGDFHVGKEIANEADIALNCKYE